MTREVICLSSQPWNDPLWTNKQHIMSRLADRGWEVLFAEPPGSRPVFSARGFRPRRLLRMLRAVRVRERVAVWRTGCLVGRPAGALGGIEARLLARAARRQGLGDPLLWVYHPALAPAVRAFPGALVLYDCVDDYASFPQLAAAAAEVRALERELLRRADVVTASSRALFEAVSPWNSNTHLVENAADFGHFQRAADSAPDPELAALPAPRIGFVGALAEYKLDDELVADCARLRPRWSFVLVGPEGPRSRRPAWRELCNVKALGFRPYAGLPRVMAACDALWIPYRRGPHLAACFPIKFFEYLATGKPVVTTPLPALQRYAHLVRVADAAPGLVAALEAALFDDPPGARAARLAAARENTWEHRIERILRLLERARTA